MKFPFFKRTHSRNRNTTDMTEQQQEQNQNINPEDTLEAAPEATETPEGQLLALEAKVAELQDAYLRAKADGENLRRRAAEDVTKAHKFAVEKFARELIAVCDSLDAALADTAADAATLRSGVELTQKQLLGALERSGMKVENPAAGDKFDPNQHQAIAMVDADQPGNTVVNVLQKGYQLSDRVLRPAMVTVANG
ncbi:MAG: nucleotide exchange factor GrpE [Fluviibacter sp.]|jgi:molecular chaperone GrpE